MKFIKNLLLAASIILSLQVMGMQDLGSVEIDAAELSDEEKDSLIGFKDSIDDTIFERLSRNRYLYLKYSKDPHLDDGTQEYKDFFLRYSHVAKLADELLVSEDSFESAKSVIKLHVFNSAIISQKKKEALNSRYERIKNNSKFQSELNDWRRAFATSIAEILIKKEDSDDKYLFVLKAALTNHFHGSIGYPGNTIIFDLNCVGMRQRIGVSNINIALCQPGKWQITC